MPVDLNEARRAPFEARASAIVSGLAVDQEPAAFGRLVGNLGAGRVALFAADEQQANPEACRAQSFGSRNLGGDDALGVGNAAAVHEFVVFAEGNVGRHGVHVG